MGSDPPWATPISREPILGVGYTRKGFAITWIASKTKEVTIAEHLFL